MQLRFSQFQYRKHLKFTIAAISVARSSQAMRSGGSARPAARFSDVAESVSPPPSSGSSASDSRERGPPACRGRSCRPRHRLLHRRRRDSDSGGSAGRRGSASASGTSAPSAGRTATPTRTASDLRGSGSAGSRGPAGLEARREPGRVPALLLLRPGGTDLPQPVR